MIEATAFKSVVSPVLVGRAQSLAATEQLLRRARDGHGQTLLVTGEAGIGKSRLVAEIKSNALAQGFISLQGNCFETDRTLPYAPILDLLRREISAAAVPEIERDFGAHARELVKLLPELSRILPDLVPTPALEPESEKRRLFQTLSQFFTKLAKL